MQKITLDLQAQCSPKTQLFQRGVFGLFGVINLAQAYLQEGNFRYVNLFVGITAIAFALFFHRIHKPRVFTFDDNGIAGPISRRESIALSWQDIEYIKPTIFSLHICKKDGQRFKLNLGNLTFQQHKTEKQQILELAKSKGVSVRST